jgi:hypothetical protein
MRTANTVRCVVRHRHRRVPAPVQSADRPAQSRESVLVVSTIMVIAKAHPSLPSDSRSRAHSSHLTSHDGHSENLKSPTARRCELLRRMTSSRPRSTRRGCAVTAGSHLLCGQSRCELAEPASCLPVVSLIGWYLVLAPICPRRNSVRVRNIFSTANPALIPASHDPKSESDKRKTISRIAPKSAERIHVANSQLHLPPESCDLSVANMCLRHS